MTPRVSVCIPTWNKAEYLKQTLESFAFQITTFDMEIIIVNDGSTDNTAGIIDATSLLSPHSVVAINLPQKLVWRECSVAMNTALRAARGEIIIWTCDDVVHEGPYTIERLVAAMRPGIFTLAACKHEEMLGGWGTHSTINAPWPFLGAFWREDIYAIGGLDERFKDGACGTDDWFLDCLGHRGVKWEFHDEILSRHLKHPRYVPDYKEKRDANWSLLRELRASGVFQTETAPWPMT